MAAGIFKTSFSQDRIEPDDPLAAHLRHAPILSPTSVRLRAAAPARARHPTVSPQAGPIGRSLLALATPLLRRKPVRLQAQPGK